MEAFNGLKSCELLNQYENYRLLENRNRMLLTFTEYRNVTDNIKLAECRVEILKPINEELQVFLALYSEQSTLPNIRVESFSSWFDVSKYVIPRTTFYRCTSMIVKLEEVLDEQISLPAKCEGNLSIICTSLQNMEHILDSLSCTALSKIHLESNDKKEHQTIDTLIQKVVEKSRNLESLHFEGFTINVSFLAQLNKLKFHQNTRWHMEVSGTLEDTEEQLPEIHRLMRQTAGLSLNDIHITLLFRIPFITTLLDQVFSLNIPLEKNKAWDDYWTAYNPLLYMGKRVSFITYCRTSEVSLRFTKYQRSSPPTRIRLSNGAIVRKTTLGFANYQAKLCGVSPVDALCQQLHDKEVMEVPGRYQQVRRPPRMNRQLREAIKMSLQSI